MTNPKEAPWDGERLAQLYANCRNGQQGGVNFTEWQRSHDGHLAGSEARAALAAAKERGEKDG